MVEICADIEAAAHLIFGGELEIDRAGARGGLCIGCLDAADESLIEVI